MSFENPPLSKNNSNNQLLSILTRRQAKSLVNLKNDWPGKHGPSLVNIYPHKLLTLNKKPGFNFEKESINGRKTGFSDTGKKERSCASMSLIQANSKSISLKPTRRVQKMSDTWRTTQNKKFLQTGNTFKESSHSSKVESHFKNNKIINIISTPPQSAKREIVKQMLEEGPTKDPKIIVNNYVVDYSSFNFLDKVIDDPEKWLKFVHKKVQKKN